jgi:hypothetical protein
MFVVDIQSYLDQINKMSGTFEKKLKYFFLLSHKIIS